MPKAIRILLVEDDQDDVEFLKEALDKNKVSHSMEVITKGDEVITHLGKTLHYPDVIVLDLNLPRMHGKEVLKRLKAHVTYKSMPIIILTTSSANLDTQFCLQQGAKKFITKPINKDGFDKLVHDILEIATSK